MRLPVSSSLRRRLRLPHPVRRRAPTAGTVGLRNPASREPVRVRGNQVFGERSGATTGSTTSSSDDEFLHTDNFFPDLSDFFDNLNMGDNDAAANATDARPEGPLSAEEQEKFAKVDAMFKAALFSILGDNIVDPYMAFDHGKDAWDALEAKFGVSDAGTELYVMEQYYDYRMTDERSVVEQAHEIQSLAKELEQFKCTLPDKFVAGGIIAKLPPSWRNFATSLKHKRQEFSVSDLIGSLHVEEKARAKDTRARSFEGGSVPMWYRRRTSNLTSLRIRTMEKASLTRRTKPPTQPTSRGRLLIRRKGIAMFVALLDIGLLIAQNVMIGVGTAVARTSSVLMGNGSRASVRGVEHFDNPVEDDNEAPKRSKRQRTAKSFGHDFIVYLVDDTPTSISEAYASQDADYWKEAVRSEMDSILANGTWEVTDRPYGCKPVGCKWVFKKKLRPDGTIEKYKARLVAKGYTQKEGTASYGIHYTGYPRVLEGYSDANWISDADETKATSGYLFTLGGGAVSWKSCKQTIITRFWGALATTGSTTSSSDDEFLHTDNFFPDLSDFFDNLNMGDNDAAANARQRSAPARKANGRNLPPPPRPHFPTSRRREIQPPPVDSVAGPAAARRRGVDPPRPRPLLAAAAAPPRCDARAAASDGQ
ncbi:hypothetical protein QYE76_063928 [Lolium multiflorum]|uniref:Reverse transcriptase Ty1/copia-type domain-containing protein n=1 Tax=Lolium multiflorum TaxID=4521 RepID=A0AAD8S7E0_LOLMU|nr:hypothetical protein QYE76_063928 [Lolium multiflorum]